METSSPPPPEGQSSDQLFAEVYDRLKAIAGRQRGREAPQTLSTTEIVHELYLRMGTDEARRFGQPVQFFAYAARAMRHLMIDLARRRMQHKAGGDLARVTLTESVADNVVFSPLQAFDLDAGLRALEVDDPRAAKVVELHYFAGLSLVRIAELLEVTVRTIDRDWAYARSFLSAHVGPDPAGVR
jgi:RNA polymerase sigma factor (TIGR02999 family)